MWSNGRAWESEPGLLVPSQPGCQLNCSEHVFLSAGEIFKSHLALRPTDLMRIILPAQPTDWAVVGIKGDHIYETTFVEGQKIKECDTINSF